MSGSKRISAGQTIPHTPGSALTAGDVVVQGDLIGIAEVDIAAGQLGSLAVEGEFQVTKGSGVTIATGELAYWDDSNNRITSTASGNKLMGKMTEDTGSSDLLGKIKLTP